MISSGVPDPLECSVAISELAIMTLGRYLIFGSLDPQGDTFQPEVEFLFCKPQCLGSPPYRGPGGLCGIISPIKNAGRASLLDLKLSQTLS